MTQTANHSIERDARDPAHTLASEIAHRVATGQALGRPSVYNIAREVLAEALDGATEVALPPLLQRYGR